MDNKELVEKILSTEWQPTASAPSSVHQQYQDPDQKYLVGLQSTGRDEAGNLWEKYTFRLFNEEKTQAPDLVGEFSIIYKPDGKREIQTESGSVAVPENFRLGKSQQQSFLDSDPLFAAALSQQDKAMAAAPQAGRSLLG